MKHYIIEKTYSEKKVISYQEKDGYSFLPKSMASSKKIKKITIIDDDLNEKIIIKKLDKEYRRLLSILYSILSSNDTESGDILVAFSEIKRLEDILLFKYKRLLKKEQLEKYLKKLKLLEIELNKVNLARRTYMEELEVEERKGKGR